MQFYIQINEEGYITDCIEYAYRDYIPAEFATPLPDAFIAGCYRYLGNGQFELDEDKYAEIHREDATS